MNNRFTWQTVLVDGSAWLIIYNFKRVLLHFSFGKKKMGVSHIPETLN